MSGDCKKGENGRRRTHCEVRGKTVFKRFYSMDWIKGKPGGRGRQKDRTAVSQYLLCAPFPTTARRHTERAPRNRGGEMDGREPSECGSDFRERLLVSERGGLFCRKRNFGQNSGLEKRSNPEDGCALSENFNLNKYDKSRKGAFQSGSYRKRKRYFSARNLYNHRRKRRRKPIGTNA